MPLVYTVSPLDTHGQTIPAKMPYDSPLDPLNGNRRVLLVADEVLAAAGAAGAKSNKQILADAINAAAEWKAKVPMRLPVSCSSVKVTSEAGYVAHYDICPLLYKPCTIRVVNEKSAFAEFYGQPFQAEWAWWPFGREERIGTITVRITEPLPYGEDERSTNMGREMINAALKPGMRAHFTGMNLRMAVANVAAPRIRPRLIAAPKRAAAAGRRA